MEEWFHDFQCFSQTDLPAGASDSPPTVQPCHIGSVTGGGELVALSTTSDIVLVVGLVVLFVVAIVVARQLGKRSGRRSISQRLTALGSRLGLDPPEDESNIETALAYLEQVTGGASQAVAESSADAIRLRRSLDT